MQHAFVKSIRDSLGTTRTEAKTQALSWLAKELQWERTLGLLRAGQSEAVARAA